MQVQILYTSKKISQMDVIVHSCTRREIYRSTIHSATSRTSGNVPTDKSEEIDGNLIFDKEIKKATRYEYDVTNFVKSQVGAMGTNKMSLQMIMSKYGGSTENVVISQQDRNADYRIRLEIKYSVYNEK